MRPISMERLSLFSAALLLGLIAAAVHSPALRAFLALPLVFYIPGHMILRLFPCYYRMGLEGALYAFGVSIAVVMFGGFLLHAIGQMTPLGWALLLCSISAVSFGASEWRTNAASSLNFFTIPKITPRQALMLACAAVLASAAVLYEREAEIAYSEFKYTELWMVPQDASNPNALTIGIANHEGKPASYEVELMEDGQIAGALRSILLQPGENWTSAFNASLRADRIQRVEAWLYKNQDHSTVYRRVWADIGPS